MAVTRKQRERRSADLYKRANRHACRDPLLEYSWERAIAFRSFVAGWRARHNVGQKLLREFKRTGRLPK